MASHRRAPVSPRFLLAIAGIVLATSAASFAAVKQPVKKPTYDSSYPVVELFDAIEQGLVEATVIPKSAQQSNLFITNKSGAPLTVKVPQAVVAVHVLKQFLQPGVQGQGPQGLQGGAGAGQGGGAGQAVGGGVQGTQGNQGQGNGVANVGNGLQGNNFFSIASEKVIQLPLKTVCLNHGKPDPRPKMTYRLVKVEEYTSDRVLPEVLRMYAAGEADAQAAQAAAWRLTDKMSWKELQDKSVIQLGGLSPAPYFTVKELKAAQGLLAAAELKVKTGAAASGDKEASGDSAATLKSPGTAEEVAAPRRRKARK